VALLEWQERYSEEGACVAALIKMRWPTGFECPRCSGKRSWFIKGYNLFECAECHEQISVTSGTLFHASKLPLMKWFVAIYFVAMDKGGISAERLRKYIDVSWQTANLMLVKIRTAMGDQDQQYLLNGLIELDEAFIGGKTTGGKRGRGSENKTAIWVACEHDAEHKRAGYLKMKAVEKLDAVSVKTFTQEAISPEQDLRTDGSPTLKTLEGTHRVEARVVAPKDTAKWLPWVHVAIANLKRFLLGTYHGVSGKHLQRYLDEFCYRFNRRWCELELPNRLLSVLALHKPIPRTSL
jgi:transposase-like protein